MSEEFTGGKQINCTLMFATGPCKGYWKESFLPPCSVASHCNLCSSRNQNVYFVNFKLGLLCSQNVKSGTVFSRLCTTVFQFHNLWFLRMLLSNVSFLVIVFIYTVALKLTMKLTKTLTSKANTVIKDDPEHSNTSTLACFPLVCAHTQEVTL